MLVLKVHQCRFKNLPICLRLSKNNTPKVSHSSTKYFHMETKIFVDFQICINVPLSEQIEQHHLTL